MNKPQVYLLFVFVAFNRNFTFKSIVLTSKRGSITVDKTLLESDADITCLSGYNREGIIIILSNDCLYYNIIYYTQIVRAVVK